MPKDIPSYKHMWLYRSGLKIEPSQNFVDKFIEIYNNLVDEQYKQKSKKAKLEYATQDSAMFMICSIFEAIIYCLDFGFDVWVNQTMVFLRSLHDKTIAYLDGTKRVTRNIVFLNIKPTTSLHRRMKNKINENNKEYMAFVEEKQRHFKEIKNYYKEIYGKQEDWWQQSN